MKKVTVLFLLSCISKCLLAQTTFGLHAEGLLADVAAKQTDPGTGQQTDLGTSPRLSWGIGAGANIPVSSFLSAMPMLNLVSKGLKANASGSPAGGPNMVITGPERMTELEVPVYLVYNRELVQGGFYAGLGPVISYGLGGSYHFRLNGGGQNQDQSGSVKFDGNGNATDNNAHLKAFDFGAGLIAGYQFSNGFSLHARYTLGLSNIDPTPCSTTKTHYFALGIGFTFPRPK